LSRILAIDYGTRRIGIAVSDPLQIIARGVTTIDHTAKAVERICAFVREFEAGIIVVGMPLTLRGEKGRSATDAEAFAGQLKEAAGVDVVFWDERFSSQTAHETLLKMGVGKKARRSKERIDEMAAAIILQGYLDSRTQR
jgi:putative Holliday junction resolvase